jgi:cholinesterase
MADIVLVTLNYRLGALGFLSLKDKELKVPGNAALKDQLLALKFVKNNIEHFGGDPNNITLFGHSAGGSSVSWHCVSERSKGLFKKAIIMSGCVLNKFSLTPQRDWANRLARKLGFNGSENETEILEFLQNADPVEIVKVQDSLMEADEKSKISMAFAPHIEHYKTEDTFNSEYPIDLVRKAWSNEIDIMIGGTSDEGLMYLEYLQQNPALLKSFNLENQMPIELNLDVNDPKRQVFAEKLRKMYYSNSTDPTVDESGLFKVS